VNTGGVPSSDATLVTIGITCFNAADTIERAIDSALNQDWPNFEIVVVDDRSADESIAIIESRARGDGRIRLIRHETNKGYAGALNTILAHAKGEFVAIFDDDDVSQPDRVSEQWRRLTVYERATGADHVFCYSNREVVKEEGDGLAGFVCAIGRSSAEPHGADVADFLLWHYERPGFSWGQFGSCTLFVRRRTILDLGGFDETFRRMAEWDLAVRASLAGAHFVAVDQPLITQHLTPTSDKAGSLPLNYALKLREKYRTHLESKRVYRASKAIAHSRHHYAKERRWTSRAYLALACVLSPIRVLPSELAKWNRRKTSAS
jgi:glycosyltransferase involved in cell wall biosynthesis